MASVKQHRAAQEAALSDKTVSYNGNGGTMQVTSKTTATVRRAVSCADCGKKFDDWRLLQRHKRKTCPKFSLRFSCRECKAYFSARVELDSHIFAAHVKKEHKSKNTRSMNSSRKKVKSSSLPDSRKCTMDHSSRWKEVQKCQKKSDGVKIRKSASMRKMAMRVGKLKTRMRYAKKSKEHEKPLVETCTVGSNPFPFTTSCAPDAQSFQFLCQSCLACRFATYVELRQHEDWCARVPASQGYVCLPCGRHYRNQGTLHRHADEHHYSPFSLEVKKTLVNPYLFSTTVAQDAASHPHVCSSCLLVCFTTPALLRRHEDWCGQCSSAKDGFKCNKCGRYFRTAALLGRHTEAADCGKMDSTETAGNSIEVSKDAELRSLENDVEQKTATTHGVCPLCDVPYATQYEQQFHFLNVHNLTSSDMKIKQAFERHSKRALAGTQVTCLDCDLKVSSRLELVQHKRVCTKEKEAKCITLPIASPVSELTLVKDKSDSRSIHSANNRKSSKKGDGSRSTATMVSGTSEKIAAKCKNRSESGTDRSSVSRAVHTVGTQRSGISRGLLLNTTKVCKLISSTGAKQLMLKPHGELVGLGNGGRKSSTTYGTITGICNDKETQSTSIVNTSKPDKPISKEPSAISYVSVDSDLLIESPPSLQSIDKTNGCSLQLKTDKCISNEDPKPTTESLELLTGEENASWPEKHIQTRTHEINHNIDQQHTVCHLKTVDDHKSIEDKNVSQDAVKACSVTGKRLKLTRKRSWKNKVADAVDSDANTRSNSAHEVNTGKKSSAVEKELVIRNTRSKRSLNVPASVSGCEATVLHVESSSEATSEVQQTLLEALHLVPKSHQQNSQRTTTAGHQTRSAARARSEDSGPAAKKSRIKQSEELSKSKALGQKELQLLANRNSKETVDVNKHERKHVSTRSVAQTTHVNTSEQMKPNCSDEPASLSQITWTVEPASNGLIRCIMCKVAFRTVRQIVDHFCVGH